MARKKRRDDDHEHHDHERHDHQHDHEKRDRGSYGAYITNWNEYAAPTGKKLALAARNLFISRWHHRLLCCGHPGQPGC